MEQVVLRSLLLGTTAHDVVGYRGDLSTWTELTARVARLRHHVVDRVLIAFPYGMFTRGWGMHFGIDRIGATVFPRDPATRSDRSS
jgi:phenylacetate-CoA ligase